MWRYFTRIGWRGGGRSDAQTYAPDRPKRQPLLPQRQYPPAGFNADRKAWQEKAQYLAIVAASKQGWRFSKRQKLVMEYWTYWPDYRTRDVHNQEKLLLDTLEGVLYDNDKWVLPRAMDFAVDKVNPRIEILIYPLAGG